MEVTSGALGLSFRDEAEAAAFARQLDEALRPATNSSPGSLTDDIP